MRRHRGFLTALVIIICATGSACTRGKEEKVPRNPLASAEETVKAFCDLDGDGVRLSSETWSRILPYIAWTEEAGWDRIAVIDGYRVAEVEKRSDKLASITVVYDLAGNLSQDYMPANRKESVVFSVQKTSEGWKIKSPDFMPPHVLMKPVIRHLKETKRLELADKLESGAARNP